MFFPRKNWNFQVVAGWHITFHPEIAALPWFNQVIGNYQLSCVVWFHVSRCVWVKSYCCVSTTCERCFQGLTAFHGKRLNAKLQNCLSLQTTLPQNSRFLPSVSSCKLSKHHIPIDHDLNISRYWFCIHSFPGHLGKKSPFPPRYRLWSALCLFIGSDHGWGRQVLRMCGGS